MLVVGSRNVTTPRDMTNWTSPHALQVQAVALQRTTLVIIGVYFYELVRPIPFDWKLVTRAEKDKRPILARSVKWIYITCRLTTLIECICLTVLNTSRGALDCQVLMTMINLTGYLTAVTGTLLLFVRRRYLGMEEMGHRDLHFDVHNLCCARFAHCRTCTCDLHNKSYWPFLRHKLNVHNEPMEHITDTHHGRRIGGISILGTPTLGRCARLSLQHLVRSLESEHALFGAGHSFGSPDDCILFPRVQRVYGPDVRCARDSDPTHRRYAVLPLVDELYG
ncbi:hypothetical protein PENSPDRAFT_341097 [Peniophora sp. CONT]|nr:hypothetical protein PENSPDRAFT_341097 [Peniophora sp. CONT]